MTDLDAAPTATPVTATGAQAPHRRARLRTAWRAHHDGAVTVLALLAAVACAVGILTWAIPVPITHAGFPTIVAMRVESVATIVLVGASQGVATLVFQTLVGNRILTPAVLGFDALYRLVQTALVFFLGSAALAETDGLLKVGLQSALMVAFATILYGWLFTRLRLSLHVTLLVGIVLGMAFSSAATLMQRMLTPSEFDILAARLFGNISTADGSYLPWAALVVAAACAVLWRRRYVLDVVALGRPTATSLGVAYRREVLLVLVLVAVLVSVSVSLVGPMTFLGFIVAMLTYQLVRQQTHARMLPMAAVLGALALLAAYFVLRHVFYAGGLVTVVIELVGGTLFLIYLLRKGLR